MRALYDRYRPTFFQRARCWRSIRTMRCCAACEAAEVSIDDDLILF